MQQSPRLSAGNQGHMKVLHILLVIGIKLNFRKTLSLEHIENPFQIMQDSILVIKRTKLVSARSTARDPVFLQLAYS